MKQGGQVFKSHGAWFVRFYEDQMVDGQPVRRRVTKRLAAVSPEFSREGDLRDEVKKVIDPVNRVATTAEGSLLLDDFVERYFLPWVESELKPSTRKFYAEAYDNHISDRVGQTRLKDFTARHAQLVLDNMAGLSHSSVTGIKVTMSAIFSYAIRLGFLNGSNPVREARAKGKRTDPTLYAYTLKEVQWMLERLDEPARTVVAVAAFTGLRESEIRGLQWQDYDGTYLHVQRSIWRTHIGETKTKKSASSVPVISPLRKILDLHKRRDGAGPWVFAGQKKGFALNLDNLRARDIAPIVGARWHGWHGFRRGLATNLFELGVPVETAKIILRHANVATTQAHYVVLKSTREGAAAMRKLEKAVTKWASKPGNSGVLGKGLGSKLGSRQKTETSRKPA
jgi:integrase